MYSLRFVTLFVVLAINGESFSFPNFSFFPNVLSKGQEVEGVSDRGKSLVAVFSQRANIKANAQDEHDQHRKEIRQTKLPTDEPGLDKSKLDKPGLDKPEKSKSGLDEPGQSKSGVDKPGQSKSGLDKPGQDKPGQSKSGLDKPGLDKPGQDKPGESKSGLDKPGLDKPGQDKPGESKSGLDKPGLDKPKQSQSGLDKPKQGQSGLDKPKQGQSGLDKPKTNGPKQTDSSKVCPDKSPSQQPYPADCHQFYNCWEGFGLLQMCAPGTLFNRDTLICDFAHNVKC